MVQIGPEPLHPCESIADRAGQRGFGGDPDKLGLQPDLQIIENRSGLVLADDLSPVGRLAAGFGLDLIEFLDARQGFFGDG